MRSFRIWASVAALLALVVAPLENAYAWGRFPGGHHPDYHPHWVQRGCVGCGAGAAAVAGLVGGAIVGAAIAGSAPRQVIVAQPPVVIAQPPIGAQVVALPAGCASMNVNNQQYYQCGPVWYQPFFGANGVYYAVVPTP